MTYDTISPDKSLQNVKLFPEITEESTSYTFASPTGLLYATQFTQPALTLFEKAAFEDMRAKGLVSPCSVFAGHSLGEYAALASVGDVLSIEILCDIVFYRGLAMQVAVERDLEGRSRYGMAAINPTRVGHGFDGAALQKLVPCIAIETGRLLEIVNYNVENWQYVVAGDLLAIDVLSKSLDHVAKQNHLDARRTIIIGEEGLKKTGTKMNNIIQQAISECLEKEKKKGIITLERGIAMIPLAGIDVPFHSSFLLGGVPSFRRCLESKIRASSIDPKVLRNNYIPNLIGKPFEISLQYVQESLKKCNSDVLCALASNWKDSDLQDAAKVQEIGRTIIIEFLAFQFASPVLWTETQDILFRNLAIERLIEIGPSPVLVGMAERTLKLKFQQYDDVMNQNRTLLNYVRDRSEIYYENQKVVIPESTTCQIVKDKKKESPEQSHAIPVRAQTQTKLNFLKRYE